MNDTNYDAFAEDLRELINRHSMEIGSHTPDHILTDYLIGCLRVFDKIVPGRDRWYDSAKAGYSKEEYDKQHPVRTEEELVQGLASMQEALSDMAAVSDETKAKIEQSIRDNKGY